MAKSDARERERETSFGNMSDAGAPTRDHFSMHAATLAAAQRRVEHLERAIALESQRRHEEELRALLEGSDPLPASQCKLIPVSVLHKGFHCDSPELHSMSV